MRKKTKLRSPRPRRLRLAIYGGTFDPIHHGHLLLARDALEQLKLDAVLFVPVARSPFKERRPQATDAQRIALLKLALESEPRFWLSRCELDRPAPSYAYDTACEIGDAFPRAELFWLIGGDQVPDLGKWHRAVELQELVTFVVLQRGDRAGARGKVLSLPQPRRVDISATEIRQRVKACLPIDHLVPASVAAYIKRRSLYL